jgi:hypothetical protein
MTSGHTGRQRGTHVFLQIFASTLGKRCEEREPARTTYFYIELLINIIVDAPAIFFRDARQTKAAQLPAPEMNRRGN